MGTHNEHVLVVPRTSLSNILPFRGFLPSGTLKPESWLPDSSFKPRANMEEDPSYKQFIPYIVLTHQEWVYRYWRTKRGGENRLHHMYSIGIGGHINPQDDNLFTQTDERFLEAAIRELKEEVNVAPPETLPFCGFINDDDSDVGKVHLGLVYQAEIKSREITPNESAIGRGEWCKRDSLLDGVEYETWSHFVITDFLLSQTT